jgi:glutathione S-transferase
LEISIFENAHATEYLTINPNGRIPTSDEDSFILWESLAINVYLAKKHELGTLYPKDGEGEARA